MRKFRRDVIKTVDKAATFLYSWLMECKNRAMVRWTRQVDNMMQPRFFTPECQGIKGNLP